MGMEYMRWRIDEEKKNDRPLFRGFVNWLKEAQPERFERLPTVWRAVHDDEDPAGYRSFRLVLDPDSRTAIPVGFFTMAIDEPLRERVPQVAVRGDGLARPLLRRVPRLAECMIDVARLAADLIAFRSENPPGDTRDCAEYVRDRLEALGLRTVIAGETAERANVVANGCAADLLLCGHLDVVPALDETWSFDPFGGEVRDGYVLGRGATDMKGGCAALIAAVADAVERGLDVSMIGLAFVCDEETGGGGIGHLLRAGLLSPCDCLIAEPTPAGAPCIGQKGLLRARFRFTGEPGHASLYPVRGVSSVMDAVALIEHVRRLHERLFDPGPELAPVIADSERVLEAAFDAPGTGTVLRRISYNPGRIEGGEKANIVAERCDLELDLRLPWGCDPGTLADDLRAHAPRAVMECMSASAPSCTPPGARIVGRIAAAIEAVRGMPAIPIVQWAASDARALRLAGFPTVEYGPGELARVHAVDERVPVAALEEAVAVYARLIEAYA